MNINGKTIIITGASSGIGAACAELLADKKANLVLIARRLDKMQQLASKLAKTGEQNIVCIPLDIQDKTAINAAVAEVINDFGTIDVLINNAGTPEGANSFPEMNNDAFDQIIDTNLKGVLYMTRACLMQMKQQSAAHIINIGSIGSHLVSRGGSVYCATKHAIKAFSDGLRLDLLGSDIRVSTISPGFVDTEFVDVLVHGDDKKKQSFYKGTTPLLPQDIAEAIYYAINCPARVNIDEIVILPTKQAGLELYRGE